MPEPETLNPDRVLDEIGAREESGGVSFCVKAIPKSGANSVKIAPGGLTIKLKSPPVDGKANEDLRRFLASVLGVCPGAVAITSGETSRRKRVFIRGLTRQGLLQALASAKSPEKLR
ncbi:MAG: DUF167 domain-containing protein [Firmicutes bacterium]|nr:DUF167 domain-containing protein [Candidatus Fermentithermobacillaceae bacterium]